MQDDKKGLARRSQTDPENKMRMMAVLVQNDEAFKAIRDKALVSGLVYNKD